MKPQYLKHLFASFDKKINQYSNGYGSTRCDYDLASLHWCSCSVLTDNEIDRKDRNQSEDDNKCYRHMYWQKVCCDTSRVIGLS